MHFLLPDNRISLLKTCAAITWLWLHSTLLAGDLLASEVAAAEIDFDRDVRPILSDKCFACHGPDEAERQSELRFDQRSSVFADLGGYSAVIPGHPDESEMVRRVFSTDPDEQMPPPETKLGISDSEKEILRAWVAQGAPWSEHWSFVPPRRSELPAVTDAAWSKSPIDRFVFARLAEAGLAPSGRADRERLLRRVTLDLTGLPPTIAEIDAFLADNSEDAFARVVDRLLSSDACAERLALDWMDVARYADSHGMHADGWRRMWPWRDWVISAFRRNLPYDQFVTWQIAGDLLPNATEEQILATAFHRNHPMTAEGGVIDEEFRLLYVFDRVETTATAFLGLTLQCARCHDHKFDPIAQREYYQLAAFYNNVRELGMTGDDGNYAPYLLLPTDAERERLAQLHEQIREAEAKQTAARAAADAKFQEFVGDANELTVEVPAGVRFPLERAEAAEGDSAKWLIDGDARATTAIEPQFVDAIEGQGIRLTDEYGFLSLAEVGHFDAADTFSAALWVRPEQPLDGLAPTAMRTLLGTAGQKNQLWRGWEFNLDGQNRLVVRLIHSLPDNQIVVRADERLSVDSWVHAAFTYQGTGRGEGVAIYVNGRRVATTVVADELSRSIRPVQHAVGFPIDEERAVRVGRSYRSFTGEFGIFLGSLDEIRMWDEALTAAEVAQLVADAEKPAVDTGNGSAEQAATVPARKAVQDRVGRVAFEHWLRRRYEPYREATQALRALRAERFQLLSEVPEIMVMSEMSEPRTTHVLYRGEYTQPQQPVEPGTPAAVLGFPDELEPNRLGLASWLVHPDNTLTARVAVNHYWQLLFGHGLVRTPHDFGVQGERPTHPRLLDNLALDFRDSGWNLRELLRTIVLSETYCQSSVVRPDLQRHDPQNRLLGRSPSYRWPAEFLRDQALAASGLLVRKVGGPSVKPYQPTGLWIERNNFSQYLLKYEMDEGSELYRRSLYTFIRRTSPPPAMVALDAPNRSVCTVKREVTNTPLQALVLMNDPQFVEAARVLGERVLQEGGATFEERCELAFRLTLSRRPTSDELAIFQRHLVRQTKRFKDDRAAAEQLLEVGESPRADDLEPSEAAAWAVLANTLMNYDEFYMKR